MYRADNEFSKKKQRSLWRVYNYIQRHKGATVRDIMRDVAIAKSTAYEILKLLEDLNLVEKDYRGTRIAHYWPAEPISDFDEFTEYLRRNHVRLNVTVYDFADRLEEDFKAFGVMADFLGAVAIQRRLMQTTGVPPAPRVTRDINIGTVTEEVGKVRKILELEGFHYSRTKYNVIVYSNRKYGIIVWIHPDGFPSPIHPNILAIDFSEFLKTTGKIPVEVTIAGKFFDYPYMAKKNIQDLTVILSRDPEVNLDLVVDLFYKAIKKDPPLKDLILNSLSFYLTADDSSIMPDDLAIARKKAKYILDTLKTKLELEERAGARAYATTRMMNRVGAP